MSYGIASRRCSEAASEPGRVAFRAARRSTSAARGFPIRVNTSAQLQAVATRYGLSVKKTLDRGNGGLLVVDGARAHALKDQIKADSSVAWIEDDAVIPLDDNGENT